MIFVLYSYIDMMNKGYVQYLLLPLLLVCVLIGCIQQTRPESGQSANEELKSFQFADPDLAATLIASEPNIISPVDICWDPDGALYVAEMTGYPVTTGKGAIKKLKDLDGDGFYEHMSVFAGDLDFPSSVMYFNQGVLVADAPHIYYLQDTDLDGKADHREILITGFTKGNEQYLVNALQWGLDNWIYAANGRNGGTLTYADGQGKTVVNNRDIRFNPSKKKIETITGLSQFGLAMDNWGNRFISLNHRFARQVILEEHHLDRNPALAPHTVFDTYQSEHDRRVFTLLKGTMRFNRDPVGYFTSLSGVTAYRGHLLGPGYETSFFAGESVQAAIIHRSMVSNGVPFAAQNPERGKEFMVSTDDWFHPVNFANGPDGALYVVDFYRKFVEHPEWVHQDKGEGIDWNIGEQHGRIWRIAHRDATLDYRELKPELHQASTEELVQQLSHPASWRRDMAQQLLVEAQKREAAPFLEAILQKGKLLGRLHALWVMDGLGLLTDKHILDALNDDNDRIRVQGIRLAEKNIKSSHSQPLITKLSSLAREQNALIRFKAILALGGLDDVQIRSALINSFVQFGDDWTRLALLSSTADWSRPFAQAILNFYGKTNPDSSDISFLRQVGNMVAHDHADQHQSQWISDLQNVGETRKTADIPMLAGYLNARKSNGHKIPKLPTPFVTRLSKLITNSSPQLAKCGTELLAYGASHNAHPRLMDIALNAKDNQVRISAIHTIAALNNYKLYEALLKQITSMDPGVRKALIASALASHEAGSSLLQAIENKEIKLTEVPEEIRQGLMAHSNEELKNRALRILGSAVHKDRQIVIDQYLASIGNQTVDLNNGAEIFATNCTTCHAVHGEGGLLGPDLTNIGTRSDEVLITSILDPSRMVSYELKLHVIVTKTGEVYSGTVSSETISSKTIKSPGGEEYTVLKRNIEKETVTEQSIMPEGYERIIDEQDMADLIGFLRQPVPLEPIQ